MDIVECIEHMLVEDKHEYICSKYAFVEIYKEIVLLRKKQRYMDVKSEQELDILLLEPVVDDKSFEQEDEKLIDQFEEIDFLRINQIPGRCKDCRYSYRGGGSSDYCCTQWAGAYSNNPEVSENGFCHNFDEKK